jgi:hypothetical protein
VHDLTTNIWTTGVHVATNWDAGGHSCGASSHSGQPFVFTTSTTGHIYRIKGIRLLPGCNDNPVNTGEPKCDGFDLTFRGDTEGVSPVV